MADGERIDNWCTGCGAIFLGKKPLAHLFHCPGGAPFPKPRPMTFTRASYLEAMRVLQGGLPRERDN